VEGCNGGADAVGRRSSKSASCSGSRADLLPAVDLGALCLPGRVNRVLGALAGNELRLKVEMIDEGAVIDGLQKVANHIALGLVLAALIVARSDQTPSHVIVRTAARCFTGSAIPSPRLRRNDH
jgi:hypothetical protein